MSVRAKFIITTLAPNMSSDQGAVTGTVKLSPVMAKWDAEKKAYEDNENKDFWTATPGGLIELNLSNPVAFAFFQRGIGKAIYVDFTAAE
jgi:hypothetical protein